MKMINNTKLLRLISAIALISAVDVHAQQGGDAGPSVLEEIVVTAQRRAQSLQDVANSIEAFSGSDLDALNKSGLEDFMTSVGGVGLTRSGSGAIKIGMRGVSSIAQDDYAFGTTVGTTGMYLNDVPIQGGGALSDLNLYDLQRVEVLKGPQGTLYGEGAMGGAVKLVLNSPHLSEVEGKLQASVLNTENADSGTQVRGALNVPIVEGKVALRIVGSATDRPGFIDNVVTGEEGVNDSTSGSLRASLLVQPSDSFSAEFLVLSDELDMEGFAQQVNGLGDLQTNVLENEFNEVESDLYAMTLKYDMGFAELTSVSSWFDKERTLAQKVPLSIDEAILPIFSLPPLGFSQNETLALLDQEESFAQEIRLVSSGDEVIDWTVGAFYRDRDRDGCSYYDSPATQALNGLVKAIGLDFFAFPDTTFECGLTPPSGLDSLTRVAGETFEQTALYGEINWELSNSLELTTGLRWFDEKVLFTDAQNGYGILAFFTAPETSAETSDDDTLFKVGLSWTPSEDQLYYFNVSEGFRSGGTNLNALVTTDPDAYRFFQSDDLINYELGAKTSWQEGRLTFNGTVFYTEWSDVQAQIFVPAITNDLIGVLTSGGDAEIQGVEVQANWLATDNLMAGLTVSVQDTEFSDPLPAANIVQGSQLPNAPDVTGTFFAQYTGSAAFGEWFGRFEYLYVDEQRTVVEPVFVASPPYDDAATVLSDYDLINFTVGVRSGSWYATAFAKNLTDERYGVDYGYGQSFLLGSNPDRMAVGMPRTYGVTVGLDF